MARPDKVRELAPRLRYILRRFWPYARRHRLLLTGAMAALLAEVFLRMLEPWMLALVIDHVILPQQGGELQVPLLRDLGPTGLLVFASVGLAFAVALRAGAVYLSSIGFALVGNRVLTEVRGDLYRHLHKLSLSFHTRARGGDLTIRVIGDVGQLKDVVVTAVVPMLGNVLILVGMLTVLFWLNWQLALIAVSAFPIFWLAALSLTHKIHQVSREQRARQGRMASSAAESLRAVHVVQAMALEETFVQSFARQNQRSMKEGVKGARLAARLGRTVDVVVGISTGLVLFFGAQLVLGGDLTAGDLVVFLTYLKNALKPLRDFAKYTARLSKATAAGERVIDVFDREPDVTDLPGATPAPELRGAVCFEDVTFAYEPGKPVLSGISFAVGPGDRVALVGSSGNGKSTLVNLILRLYDPQEGRVVVDGHDVRDYTLESLRSQIAVVLQDTVLFAASVRENIGYGAPDASQEQIEAAARLASAHEFIEALPEGYDTVLGERGVNLSGGERQRIAIARAAIRDAPILILDEPTTGLDEENARKVTQALDRLTRGHTTFLVTHDLRQVTRADQILYIDGGRVVEQGSHEELLRAGGRYATLCELGAMPQVQVAGDEGDRAFTP